ncbi:rpoB [Acrasis kona]|uniref:RpoB n=1 Tax=Acrasis kona TaxID=1008807 RepID=A0AAW2YW84_9EUKA
MRNLKVVVSRCFYSTMKYTKSFHIEAHSPGKTRTLATAGKHQLTLDEPETLGGEDLGTTPLHALLASLCGCETATARYYAKKMDFDFRTIKFNHVEGILDTRGYAGIDANIPSHFNKVILKAQVETNEPHERLLQLKKKVEKHCPVYAMFVKAGIEMDCEWVAVPVK